MKDYLRPLSLSLYLFFCLYFFCRTALGEAYDGENSFADSLEAFGGGMDDPISVSIGGIQCVFLFNFQSFSYKGSVVSYKLML